MKSTDVIEKNFQKLDEIIAKMESGKLTLDESFALYKEGVELVKKCNLSLDKLEKKLQILGEDPDPETDDTNGEEK